MKVTITAEGTLLPLVYEREVTVQEAAAIKAMLEQTDLWCGTPGLAIEAARIADEIERSQDAARQARLRQRERDRHLCSSRFCRHQARDHGIHRCYLCICLKSKADVLMEAEPWACTVCGSTDTREISDERQTITVCAKCGSDE